jgi:hypothetical protein
MSSSNALLVMIFTVAWMISASQAFINSTPVVNSHTYQHDHGISIHSYKPTANRISKLMSTKNASTGVTSTLISQMAVVALKLRLKNHSGVKCDVQSSVGSLLKSAIGPVSVKGKDWASPLGLTCRYIEASVDRCQLDINSVLSKRKLILVEPAIGKAMVSLNAQDFGNFVTHPLLLKQAPVLQDRGTFEFLKENVEIQVETGVVIFYGKMMGELYKCELKRGGGSLQKARIDVSHVPSSSSNFNHDEIGINMRSLALELTNIVSDFFNDLVFELDGTFLRFSDLKVHVGNSSSSSPSLLIALAITVRKFPSPGIEF